MANWISKLKASAQVMAPSTCKVGRNVVAVGLDKTEKAVVIGTVLGIGVPLVWAEPVTARIGGKVAEFGRYLDEKAAEIDLATAKLNKINAQKALVAKSK